MQLSIELGFLHDEHDVILTTNRRPAGEQKKMLKTNQP